MAISNALLTTCRAAIVLTPEYTAYRAALAALDAASEPDRLTKWTLAYSDAQLGGSPALQLRQAIRAVVLNQDLSALSVPEREEICRTLAALYLRDDERPQTAAEERATLTELLAAGLAE